MATKRKGWFRVADSIREENWSNDQLACVVRLWAEMHARWARNGLSADQAETVLLGRAQVMAISGKHRADIAEMSLRSLADVVSITVERRGEVVAITWPKWVEFQGLRALETPPKNPGNAPRARASSRSRSRSRSRAEEEEGGVRSTKDDQSSVGRVTEFPDHLTDDFFARLATPSENPWGKQFKPETPRIWLRHEWPRMSGRFTRAGLKRAIVSWWWRSYEIDPDCIRKAIAWHERQKPREAQVNTDAHDQAAPSPPPTSAEMSKLLAEAGLNP